MLPKMMALFAVLVVAGAALYFIDQQLAGWIVAVFASGLAGALVGELFTRERASAARRSRTGRSGTPAHQAMESSGEEADLGRDADTGTGGPDTDDPGRSEGLPGPGGSRSRTDGDVERSSGGGTLHRGGKAHWRIYLQLVVGWRRK